MQKLKKITFLCLFAFSLFIDTSGEKSDPWQKWLDEVQLIMSKAELSVFKSLQTEEDRRRFQKLFWETRDPNPRTPQNEYMIEYYNRRQYAETQLDGTNSDRGRIYILLGKPIEKSNFSGYEKVVDCELWEYRAEGRPGLPSFMNLLFYKQADFGEYRLFYPGINTALDIISPTYTYEVGSREQAFDIIRSSFPELAHATVSIIPGESDSGLAMPMSSSGAALAQIFTLPEREVQKSYLSSFKTIEGQVDVTYMTKEIGGKGSLSISESRGFKFLSYSLMPDAIQTDKISENVHLAKIKYNLRIEDSEGKTIHQQERAIDFKFDDAQKKEILERKFVFKDFVPIVEGEYTVSVTFLNKTTDEFYVYREKINISDKTVPVIIGHKVKEVSSDNFVPSSMENFKVLSDPRCIFSRRDSLQGLIYTDQMPKIFLNNIEDEQNSIEIKDIAREGNVLIFRQPLTEIKPGNYTLSMRNENGEFYSRIISVLSFEIEKPIEFERSELPSSEYNYIFVMGQEYLNKGDAEKALLSFKRLPENMWNRATLPTIAQAYYEINDYEKVVELLEKGNVERNFSVLLLLGNSSLELKEWQKAAEYFELLRKYGDTVQVNRVLGAIYYSLGDREKAKVYWDRAKSLEEKSSQKKLERDKE